jgi:hypothetical protein
MIKITTESTNVKKTIEGAAKVFDFGIVAKDTDTSFTLLIEGHPLTSVHVKTYCGCTAADPKRQSEDSFSVLITYKNSHITKPFAKTVDLNITQGSHTVTEQIKIKGIIK